MKTELTDSETKFLLPKIRKVIATGVSWEDEKLHHPAKAIVDAVRTIKGMETKTTENSNRDGFDSNGWQWDWWQHFTCGGKDYTLVGSGYYGGHAFYLSNE